MEHNTNCSFKSGLNKYFRTVINWYFSTTLSNQFSIEGNSTHVVKVDMWNLRKHVEVVASRTVSCDCTTSACIWGNLV